MAAEQNNQDVLEIRELILSYIQKWYWFVLSAVLCVGLAVLYLFSTTPKFDVSSSIIIRSDENAMSALPSDLMSLVGMGARGQVSDELEILNSRSIMENVIRNLDLQTSYRHKQGLRWVETYPVQPVKIIYPQAFTDTLSRILNMEVSRKKNDYQIKVQYGSRNETTYKLTSLDQPLETPLGTFLFIEKEKMEVGDKMRLTTYSMPVLVDAYCADIMGKQIKKESAVINIKTTTDCPAKAQDIINEMVRLYNEYAVFDKNIMATNAKTFIEERLSLVTIELDSIEQALERYKKDNQITSIEKEADLFLQSYSDYQKSIVEIETQINLMKYIKEFVNDPKNAHSLIPANLGIVDDPNLAMVISEYNELELKRMRVQRTATGENPMLAQLDEQIVTMRKNVVNSLNSVSEGLVITRKQIQDEESKFNNRIVNVPTQEREYINLRRQQEIKQEVYLFLFQKREENAITLASTVIPAKTIDAARKSTLPVSPRTARILLFALILGCAIPVGCLYLYSLWDNTIKNKKEYEKLIQVPFLGQLVQSRQKTKIVVTAYENSTSAELFRLLRTNLRFMLPSSSEQGNVILVTSAIPGEGKSFVAVNLATSLALLNKKVCIVGLDIRKPMLANYMNLTNRGCLTSYLASSEYTIDDVIVPSGVHDDFDVIPAGVIPPNPNELLQNERLDQLIAELRRRYDYIVLDSAPVAMVADTFLLDRFIDMTLFVSRAEKTPRELTELINQIYHEKRLKNMACVLNGVIQARAGYGYGYGYGYSKKE